MIISGSSNNGNETYNSQDYCRSCKWLEDRSDGKFVNSYRCGLYGYGVKYTHFGCIKCDKCKEK